MITIKFAARKAVLQIFFTCYSLGLLQTRFILIVVGLSLLSHNNIGQRNKGWDSTTSISISIMTFAAMRNSNSLVKGIGQNTWKTGIAFER
jgi:hypothetical protein